MLIILAIIFIGAVIYFSLIKRSPKVIEQTNTSTNIASSTQSTASIEYSDTQYGFTFTLPSSWQGYSIATNTWEGNAIGPEGNVPTERGPEISIRHPLWTVQNPRQDIPIMVFTLNQWDLMLRDKFHIGAAPINPSRLGFNANYVFALPARYNYAFRLGWEEVEKILANNPLKAIPSSSAISDDGKVLLCGGLPNGSTEKVKETSRLFINIPKEAYPDRDHNLNFKTVKGNATAGWISNAGPYGEAFESISECWSYYYEFDGTGEVDLKVKNALQGRPDYLVRFIVAPTQ